MRLELAAYHGRSLLERLGFLVLACWVACGCGASTLRPAASSDELVTDRTLMVRPGSLDARNRYPSTVQVYSSGKQCSGTVIAPRLILTAGHCVCNLRPATLEESKELAGAKYGPKGTRAHALRGRSVTAVITPSDCAGQATVKTFLYDSSERRDAPREQRFEGEVRAHPRLELVFNQNTAMWVNADLAVIFLPKVVKGITPVGLVDHEVQVGDGITLVGYGQGRAKRQVGESHVIEVQRLESGGVEFTAHEQPREDGKSSSHLELGDSGGGCFKADDPTVQVGINDGTRNRKGKTFSIFTSVFAFKEWLDPQIEEARARRDLP